MPCNFMHFKINCMLCVGGVLCGSRKCGYSCRVYKIDIIQFPCFTNCLCSSYGNGQHSCGEEDSGSNGGCLQAFFLTDGEEMKRIKDCVCMCVCVHACMCCIYLLCYF